MIDMENSVSKNTRKKVFDKYGGRCAYCGCKIKLSSFQIDHLVPRCAVKNKKYYGNKATEEYIYSFKNLMPSCNSCNDYKRSNKLEVFRNVYLKNLSNRLRESFLFHVAEKYGIVEVKDWDGKFYFERCNDERRPLDDN